MMCDASESLLIQIEGQSGVVRSIARMMRRKVSSTGIGTL
jgi:hypothetical protein